MNIAVLFLSHSAYYMLQMQAAINTAAECCRLCGPRCSPVQSVDISARYSNQQQLKYTSRILFAQCPLCSERCR